MFNAANAADWNCNSTSDNIDGLVTIEQHCSMKSLAPSSHVMPSLSHNAYNQRSSWTITAAGPLTTAERLLKWDCVCRVVPWDEQEDVC